jgi:hypothetical protein
MGSFLNNLFVFFKTNRERMIFMDKQNGNKDLSIGDMPALNAVIEKYEPQSSKGEPAPKSKNTDNLQR